MARATKKRIFFALFCKDCQDKQGKRRENYKILLNTRNTNPKEFTARKFCAACNKHEIHKAKQISRSQNK